MARSRPKVVENDSTLAFLFLFLYTFFVLVRPHEMFQASNEWILIRVFAIASFALVLATQRPLKMYPQHWMLLSLIPLIIVSGFLNGWGTLGIEQSQKLFISSIIPLFLFTVLITTIKRQHALMTICIVAALVMVANGHYQQTHIFGWTPETVAVYACGDCTELRITYLGFFSDPNDLGMFLVMNIPFVLYFYTKGNFTKKLIMLTILAALLYGVYITGSRGTMLGAGALVGVYFLVTNAGPKLIVSCLLLAPIAAVVFMSLQGDVDESATGRLEAWYFGLQMLMYNPIFGIGRGNFVEMHGLTAHNSYVLVAAELGVPGYSLWCGAVIFTVLSSYLFIKAAKTISPDELTTEQKDELLLNKTLFYSMVGFMITAFFLSRSYTLLLFIFIGMSIASNVRVIKLLPDFVIHTDKKLILKSIKYGWIILILVYIALKLGLR